ncbi:hypothetical protein [Actinokineospora auranticolor]|nr:hypothetical protein [Actinokineospora auranticolor]
MGSLYARFVFTGTVYPTITLTPKHAPCDARVTWSVVHDGA